MYSFNVCSKSVQIVNVSSYRRFRSLSSVIVLKISTFLTQSTVTRNDSTLPRLQNTNVNQARDWETLERSAESKYLVLKTIEVDVDLILQFGEVIS